MTTPRVRTLYLVRHAVAADRGPEWSDDSKRPLTHKGKAKMRQVVAGLASLGVTIDVVLTSPLTRAAETAQLLVDGLTPSPALAVATALAPGQPREALGKAIAPHERAGVVALVGHEPDLGDLAAWLVGATEPIAFKKGGVCRIDLLRLPPRGVGRLVWHATPKMLRALAAA